ncbi:MAG: hypothetical protein WCK73_14850, partial [Deltaproteobacteria bacterium]
STLREPASPWSAFHEAILALADCDSEDDAAYRAAKALVRHHGRRYFCQRARKTCGNSEGD